VNVPRHAADRPSGADVEPFGARLAAAVAERGPLCVGIDPHRSLLLEWGYRDDVDGLLILRDSFLE
jgi:orotidine-5'-phosphate decarboxylase